MEGLGRSVLVPLIGLRRELCTGLAPFALLVRFQGEQQACTVLFRDLPPMEATNGAFERPQEIEASVWLDMLDH